MIGEITKSVEQRKKELSALLKNGNDLNTEIQHQIYGAINEIDIFLRILNYHKDLETKKEIKDFKLVSSDKKQGGFFSFFDRKKVRRNKIKQNQPNEKK